MRNKITKKQFDTIIKKLKHDGELTASGILALAEDKGSLLHCLFQWNDSKAAHEYRLYQARKVIKSVNVYIEKNEEKIIHVPAIQGEGKYVRAETVVENISEFHLALDETLKMLSAAEKSVHILESVAKGDSPNQASFLAVALTSLKTANTALSNLH